MEEVNDPSPHTADNCVPPTNEDLDFRLSGEKTEPWANFVGKLSWFEGPAAQGPTAFNTLQYKNSFAFGP